MLLGDSHAVKMLDFFLEGKEFSYNLSEIADETKIKVSSLRRCLLELTNLGIIKKQKTGKIELYQLNTENQVTRGLIKLDLFISTQFIEQELEKEKITV